MESRMPGDRHVRFGGGLEYRFKDKLPVYPTMVGVEPILRIS